MMPTKQNGKQLFNLCCRARFSKPSHRRFRYCSGLLRLQERITKPAMLYQVNKTPSYFTFTTIELISNGVPLVFLFFSLREALGFDFSVRFTTLRYLANRYGNIEQMRYVDQFLSTQPKITKRTS